MKRLALIILILGWLADPAQAAVTWQNTSAVAASTGVDVTVTLGTHAADDILIAQVYVRDVDDTITWPSGWTEVASTDLSTTSRSWVAWKRAASGSETNPLIDKSTATGDTYAVVSVWRGATTTGSPFDVTWSTNTGTGDPGTTTGITTSAANHHVIVLLFEGDNGGASGTATATDPSSMPTRSWQVNATGGDASVAQWSEDRTTAGATGTVTTNLADSTPAGWHTFINALKLPSAGVTPTKRRILIWD